MPRDISVHHGAFGRVALLELSSSLVEHAHSSMHLKFWIDGDSRRLKVANEWFPFDPSRGVAINSWMPHATPKQHADQQTIFLVFYLEPDWMHAVCSQLAVPSRFRATSVPVDCNLRDLIDALASSLAAPQQCSPAFVELMTSSIVEYSLTAMSEEASVATPAEAIQNIDRRIQRSIEYMRANTSVRKNFEDVAQAAGLSRPHFFSLFRQTMNVTPGVYWNTIRVESSISHLVHSAVPLGELSATMGFSEPANFSRFFRQHTGVCPSKYRDGALELR